MNERTIPHIRMTPELKAAIEACPIELCSNPGDMSAVRAALKDLQGLYRFEDQSFYFDGDAAAEALALEQLNTLATLLREHIRAGNST